MNQDAPETSNSLNESSQQTLTEKVYQQLREEITQGILEPGAKLVRRQLSNRMGVSTIPIMEALRQLEQDGLVHHRSYSGTCVRPFIEQGLRDDIQLREALESQVARLCAQRHDQLDYDQLYYLAGRVDGAMAGQDITSTKGMKLHMSFHMNLAKQAQCAPIFSQLEKLWYREMMLMCWASAHIKTVPENWHMDLVKMIATGDPQRADEQSRKHVVYGREEFITYLKDNGQFSE